MAKTFYLHHFDQFNLLCNVCLEKRCAKYFLCLLVHFQNPWWRWLSINPSLYQASCSVFVVDLARATWRKNSCNRIDEPFSISFHSKTCSVLDPYFTFYVLLFWIKYNCEQKLNEETIDSHVSFLFVSLF